MQKGAFVLKKRIKTVFIIIVFSICLLGIFICYNCVLKGVSKGLLLCVNVVIPSLFPMLCLTNFLSSSGALELFAKKLNGFSKKILKLSGYFIPVFILSLISGYPVGAAAANNLFENNKILVDERNKIALISCSAGPAFILLAVGVNMYNSYKIGLVLLFSNMIACILTALTVTRFYKPSEDNSLFGGKLPYISECIVFSVKEATSSIISISAFTVVFSAIINVISQYRNSLIYIISISLLEVTNAVFSLSADGFSLPFVCSVIGFGGLSVIFQISAVLKFNRPPITKMISVRLLNGVLSYLVCKTACLIFNITVPVVKSCNTYLKITDGNISFSVALIFLCIIFLFFLQKPDIKLK